MVPLNLCARLWSPEPITFLLHPQPYKEPDGWALWREVIRGLGGRIDSRDSIRK